MTAASEGHAAINTFVALKQHILKILHLKDDWKAVLLKRIKNICKWEPFTSASTLEKRPLRSNRNMRFLHLFLFFFVFFAIPQWSEARQFNPWGRHGCHQLCGICQTTRCNVWSAQICGRGTWCDKKCHSKVSPPRACFSPIR